MGGLIMLDKNNTIFKPKDLTLAHLGLRLLLGVNFFNHGFTRIGNIPGFVEETVKTLEGSYFPEPLVRINAFIVPIVELVVGILITLGLATRLALVVTFALMVMLMMGVTSVQNWQAASSQLVYGIVLFILLATCQYNVFSLDSWWRKRNKDKASVY
jgi:thiosulfate dehydrogenase (quinone) large subunit